MRFSCLAGLFAIFCQASRLPARHWMLLSLLETSKSAFPGVCACSFLDAFTRTAPAGQGLKEIPTACQIGLLADSSISATDDASLLLLQARLDHYTPACSLRRWRLSISCQAAHFRPMALACQKPSSSKALKSSRSFRFSLATSKYLCSVFSASCKARWASSSAAASSPAESPRKQAKSRAKKSHLEIKSH